MRFCAIEYQTKLNRPWRPTKEKPNYLCDPDKEIDPTSFGCWTSALGGEHIPLSYFEGDKPFVVRLNRKLFKEKREFKRLRYLERFDVVLILVHDFSIKPFAKFLKVAKKKYPNKTYLVSIVHPLGRLREAWRDPATLRSFNCLLDRCDYWVNVNKDAQAYLQNLTLEPKKIIYFPQFYPVAFASRAFTKLENKSKEIFVAGDMNRTDNLYGQVIAAQLQRKFKDFKIILTGEKDKTNVEPLKHLGANFGFIEQNPWQRHLDRLRKFYLAINTDTSFTLGRVQSDCAISGTPSVGLNSNNQLEFFPQLAFKDVFEADKMIEATSRLIEDKVFYEKIQRFAFEKIKESSYKNSVAKLHSLLN